MFTVAYMAASSLGLIVGLRSGKGRTIGLAFGLFAGGAAGLDPILKAIGQNVSGSASLIPTELSGWLPFGLSFVLGSSGFITVQIAFLRGARASVFVPFQSSLYVLIPVVVQLLALPGYAATPILVTGIACIVAGIILMQLGRDPTAAEVQPAVPTIGVAV